jgi:methylmalonyl-CoA mutase
MNAAIDQQCEYYIKENSLEKEVEVKSMPFIKQKRPSLSRSVGNNGLRLKL